MKQSHGLGTQREPCKKKACFFFYFPTFYAKINRLLFIYFRRFWVKEPRHSENKIGKKKVYLYRSTRRLWHKGALSFRNVFRQKLLSLFHSIYTIRMLFTQAMGLLLPYGANFTSRTPYNWCCVLHKASEVDDRLSRDKVISAAMAFIACARLSPRR